jgi:hypothetical protein
MEIKMVDDEPLAFICYSSEDEEIVDKICEDFKYYGIEVWIDKFKIFPGESLRQKIFQEGIENASSFIVFITESSINSSWVQEEIDAALIKKIEDSTLLIPFLKSKDLLEKLPLDLRSKNVAFYDKENDFKKVVGSIYKSHIYKLAKQYGKNLQQIVEEKDSEVKELKEKEPNLDLYLVDETNQKVKEVVINKIPYEYRKAFMEEGNDTKQNIGILKLILHDTMPKEEEIINYINSINQIVRFKLTVVNSGNYIAKNFNIELFSSDEIAFEKELPQKPKGNFLDVGLLQNLNINKKNQKPVELVILNGNNIRFKVEELMQGYILNLREIFLCFENSSIGKKLEFKYIIVGENCKETTGKLSIFIKLQPSQTIDYETFKNKSDNELI